MPEAQYNTSTHEDPEYHLLVFPFFLQVTPRDLGATDGYAGIYVRAYGGLRAVVDLNHNGVPDEGEPFINITDAPGRFVTVFIGYSDYSRLKPAVSLPPGTGPLWLLVDRPVLAAYYWVGYSSNDYLAAYAMPPIGESITVPPIPGRVYVAPASPDGANVTVNGTTYELGPMDYLVINHVNGTLRIEADAPIAAALVAHRDGENDTYATELVPDDWLGKVNTAVFGSSVTTITGTGEHMETYAAVVTENGTALVKVGSWPATAKIGDWYYSFSGDLKAAVYYYLRNVSGSAVRSAAAVVYDSSKWWDYFGVDGYWVSSLKAYGAYVSTYSLEVFVTTSTEESTALFLDIDNDGTYEAFGWVLTPHGPVTIAPREGETVKVLAISRGGYPAYVVFADPDSYYRVYAVPVAVPVPESRADEFFSALGIGSLADVLGSKGMSAGSMWNMRWNYTAGVCRPGTSVKGMYDVTWDQEGVENMYLLSVTPDMGLYAWNMTDSPSIEVLVNYTDINNPIPQMINNFIVVTGAQNRHWIVSLHTQCMSSEELNLTIPGGAPEVWPEEPQVMSSLVPSASTTGNYIRQHRAPRPRHLLGRE